MKALIAIDAWKLPVFDRHLSDAGYTYKKGPGLSIDTLFLQVKTDDAKALETVIRAANEDAAFQKETLMAPNACLTDGSPVTPEGGL